MFALTPLRSIAGAWPTRQFQTIRSRIYVTLVAIVVLTLVVAGLTSFLLLGGYQDRVEQSRLRELSTAWGPELFSIDDEGRTLEDVLGRFETVDRLEGSIVSELDVAVLGLDSAGKVVTALESGNRFLGDNLNLDLSPLNVNQFAEGQLTTAEGERLSYVVTSLPLDQQLRQGYCCLAVALVGEPRSALLADLGPQLLIAGVVALVAASLVGFPRLTFHLSTNPARRRRLSQRRPRSAAATR